MNLTIENNWPAAALLSREQTHSGAVENAVKPLGAALQKHFHDIKKNKGMKWCYALFQIKPCGALRDVGFSECQIEKLFPLA